MADGYVTTSWADSFCLGWDQPSDGTAYCSERCQICDSQPMESASALPQESPPTSLAPVECTIGIATLCDAPCPPWLGSSSQVPLVNYSSTGDGECVKTVENPPGEKLQPVEISPKRSLTQHPTQHRNGKSNSMCRIEKDLLKSPSSGGVGWDPWRYGTYSELFLFEEHSDFSGPYSEHYDFIGSDGMPLGW